MHDVAQRRGRLIVFEGGEGSGKSTQLATLRDALLRANISCVVFKEPGGTPLGDALRQLVLDPSSDIVPRAEALMFMASRAQLIDREIIPSLDRGDVVLLDRFFLSTYAYQIAGRGLSEDSIRAANAFATERLTPDLTVLLSFPVREGLERVTHRDAGHDRIESLGEPFHDRVADAFRTFANTEWQQQHTECGPIVEVNASGSVSDIHARVRDVVNARWPGLVPDASA